MKKTLKEKNNKPVETGEWLRSNAVSFSEMKAKALQDPEFRKAYEEQQPTFKLRCALIEARIEKAMTQAEIAKKAGTTQSAIARFESGRTTPTLAFMQRLAEALGKKIEIQYVNL